MATETQRPLGILGRPFFLIEDKMHNITIRQEIIDRVLARRGRYHWFEELDPRRTALVVVDMQEVFCAPGAPAEVPASRDIVEPINRTDRGTAKARRAGHLGPARQFAICGATATGKCSSPTSSPIK